MSIIELDTQLLLAINGANGPLMDQVMWYASQALTWVPLYVLLIGVLTYLYKGNKDWRSWLPLLGAILAMSLAVGAADFISSGILKPLVCRPRPTHNEALAGLLHIVNGYTGGPFGFPSSHAANTAAVTVIFALLYSRRTYTRGQSLIGEILTVVCILLYLIPNCWSRMYLGVHYPSDILAGLLIGTLTAWGSFALYNFFAAKFADTRKM